MRGSIPGTARTPEADALIADIDSGRLTPLFDTWFVNPDQASSAISALYLPNQRGSRRIAAFPDFLAALPGPTHRPG